MKILLISFLLSIVGCEPSDVINDTNMFSGVNPTIQVYFDRFSSETKVSTEGITAGFTALSSPIVGECVKDGPYKEIRIDPTYWNSIDNDDILEEQLVFHELGHCALNLQHIPTMSSNGYYPLSIMNPYVFNTYQGSYMQNRENDYVKALINNISISYPN